MAAQDVSFATIGSGNQAQHPVSSPLLQSASAAQLQQHLEVPQLQLFENTEESVLESRLRDMKAAFEFVNRKNYELELEIAERQLSSHPPPYLSTDAGLAGFVEPAELRNLGQRAQKLRHEVRKAMINDTLFRRSRNVASRARFDRFEKSKLALKHQSLENEAHALLSNSSLAHPSNPSCPLMQSTPVK